MPSSCAVSTVQVHPLEGGPAPLTGEEMMAILEGRDPALADNFGASRDSSIEAPAKNIHMISQKIEAPEPPAEEPEAAPEGSPGSGESSEDPAP